MERTPTILIFSNFYLPGYKGGGPIRSINNLVDHLSDDFEFKIITSDRDLGDDSPYTDVSVGSWQQVEKANVYYIPTNRWSIAKMRRLILSTEFDAIYLNSFFSATYTIEILVLRKLGLIPRVPIVLAPRGEFSSGALELKKFKKKLFIWFSKVFGLYSCVEWQASSIHEVEDIQRRFGTKPKIDITINIARDLHGSIEPEETKTDISRSKRAGELHLIFVSRISRKKNLLGALHMLKGLEGKILFNIYGPIEDKEYWLECQKSIEALPPNIIVEYKGAVKPDKILMELAKHHLFLFPTYGENYGHVIAESLNSGCPVLISDQTPWKQLEDKGVGWEVSLDNIGRFREILVRCVDMDQQEFQQFSQRAKTYGYEQTNNSEGIELNRLLFRNVLEKTKK